MAQGFDVTQSLFGSVLTPQQQADSSALAQANLGGLGMAQFQAARSQEMARQQIPKIFGQQSEEDIVQDVRNKNLPILQSQGKAAYLDAIIADFTARGLGNKAFLAQQLKDQVADAEQKKQSELDLRKAQTEKAQADAKKALREPAEKTSNAAMQVKELVSMGVPQSVAIKAAYKLPDAEQTGERVNNNGIPVGTFDKVGRYKAADGSVYSNKAYTDAQSGHDAANDLLYKLSNLTKEDIVNAYGSGTDYTTMPGGGLYSRTLGSTKTYDAQVKINEIGIRNVLNNLQQLKGPSSDKEMAQMIKDFPGFTAKPSVMENWVKRAVKSTNRFLNRSEKRYGFDTDYLVPKWVQEEPRTPKANEVPPSGQPAQTPLGTMQNPIKLD